MKANILPVTSALMLLCAGMMTGCHDDNGNYTYTDLDVIEITPLGNSDDHDGTDVFTLERGDRLQISPEVSFNGKPAADIKDAPLSYMWTFYVANTGLGVDYTIDTLATTPDLDVVINRTAGSYYAQLTVTNTNTGIESYYRAVCNVEEAISAGWMLVYERADKPGYSDVGLVVNPFSKKNIQKNKEFWDLYSSSNGGEPLPGKPVSIFHETLPLPTGTPRIATTKTISTVSTANFMKVIDWNDMFYDTPDEGEIQWFGSTTKMGCREGLIMNNKLRLLGEGGMAGNPNGCFSMTKQYTSDLGELASWASTRTNGNAALESVIYSQTLGAFFYTNTGLYFRPFVAQTGVFDVNDTDGARLLFGDWEGTTLHDIILFGKGDSRFIAEANFSQTADLPNIGLKWIDVSSVPHITEATTFAVNNVGLYAYFGAGNKLYNLDYTNVRATDAWTAPDPGEEIVCVRTHKFYFITVHNAMLPNKGEILHIATWNEAKQQGKLYEYKINPASGQILTGEDSYEYTVPGKVKDMGWKYEMAM